MQSATTDDPDEDGGGTSPSPFSSQSDSASPASASASSGPPTPTTTPDGATPPRASGVPRVDVGAPPRSGGAPPDGDRAGAEGADGARPRESGVGIERTGMRAAADSGDGDDGGDGCDGAGSGRRSPAEGGTFPPTGAPRSGLGLDGARVPGADAGESDGARGDGVAAGALRRAAAEMDGEDDGGDRDGNSEDSDGLSCSDAPPGRVQSCNEVCPGDLAQHGAMEKLEREDGGDGDNDNLSEEWSRSGSEDLAAYTQRRAMAKLEREDGDAGADDERSEENGGRYCDGARGLRRDGPQPGLAEYAQRRAVAKLEREVGGGDHGGGDGDVEQGEFSEKGKCRRSEALCGDVTRTDLDHLARRGTSEKPGDEGGDGSLECSGAMAKSEREDDGDSDNYNLSEEWSRSGSEDLAAYAQRRVMAKLEREDGGADNERSEENGGRYCDGARGLRLDGPQPGLAEYAQRRAITKLEREGGGVVNGSVGAQGGLSESGKGRRSEALSSDAAQGASASRVESPTPGMSPGARAGDGGVPAGGPPAALTRQDRAVTAPPHLGGARAGGPPAASTGRERGGSLPPQLGGALSGGPPAAFTRQDRAGSLPPDLGGARAGGTPGAASARRERAMTAPPHGVAVRPGAVYVAGRAAGRLPAWGRSWRRRQVTTSLSSASDSPGGGDGRAGVVVEVEAAELAPGEAEEGAPGGEEGGAAGRGRSGAGRGGGGNPARRRLLRVSSVVLEGVPVRSMRDVTRKWLRDGGEKWPCGVLRRGRNKLFLAVAVMLIAVAVGLAVFLAMPNESSDAASSDSPGGAFVPPSGAEALNDPNSPQSQALRWLEEEDEFATPPSSPNGPVLLAQRYGLAVLYYSTGGPEAWNNSYGFLSPEHECGWQKDGIGVQCNNYNRVTEIRLDANNLTGTIPFSELVELPDLSVLSLEDNSIGGSLIDNIGDFQSLVHLSLQENLLSSTLPASLGKMTALKSLNLRLNQLNGTIPPTIGNMSSLEHFRLSYNHLKSTIPSSWTALDNLVQFRVIGNELTGTLPVVPFRNQKLRVFTAGENSFTGTIPSSLSTLASLENIWLNKNKFHGSIPKGLADLTELKLLYISSNELSGTIPPEIFASESLQVIDLGHNNLTGSLPETIGNPNDLRLLSVEMNHLTGVIPTAYGNLPSALGLSLRSNLLSGSIPSSIGENTTSLVALMLENNMLNSTVPDSLASLTNLIWLSLARNDLTGSLDSVCGVEVSAEFTIVTADCAPSDTDDVEVECDCCTICCSDSLGRCDHHFALDEYILSCYADGSCNFWSMR